MTWKQYTAALILVALSAVGMTTVQGAARQLVKVGVFDNKPIVFKQSDGTYAGLSLDVLESIADKEGWTLEYVHGSWKSVLSKLQRNEIDLLVGIAFKPERTGRFDFNNETLINNWGVVYRRPALMISSLEDLQGKRIALMSGSIHSRIFTQLMQEFSFSFTPVEVANYSLGLKSVDSGQADAVVINRVMSMVSAPAYNVMETGIIFNPVEVRYASKKGFHANLLSAIDRHLALQKDDTNSVYNRSLSKWLGTVSKARVPEWLYPALSALSVVLLLLLFSNIIVRKQVARRTAELSESEVRFRQLAENINAVFWIGSPDWQQVFYVSPAYEKLWHRSRKELYRNPMVWLDYVHEDDQQDVMKDIVKKVSGDLTVPDMPEYRFICGDSTERWILARAYPIRNEAGQVVRIAGIAEDITERKRSEQTISYMAYHDALTQLSNRNAFEYKLLTAIDSLRRQDMRHILMYIDLDQFKIVNDTCGHAAGDAMLKDLAGKLNNILPENTMLARLGGDEFGVLIENTVLEHGLQEAKTILDAIQQFRFTWEGRKFSVGASIGLVLIGDSDKSMSELLSSADMACYAAKEKGRNRIHVFNEDDEELLQRHGEMQWVPRLKTALEENRFVLYRQEIVSLLQSDSEIRHYEYLIRLLDEDGQLIPPGAFLPAAERFDLMSALDRWVVSNVFRYLGSPAGQQANGADSIAFINLSGQALTDGDLIDFILNELQANNVSPDSVCFEITETAAIANLATAISFIDRLKAKGCHFALDDFGTGMSSFSYLASLPVDFLKIDGSFIKDMFVNRMHESIVDAITRIGHTAKLQIIAEWVESGEVYDQLVKIGIDFAQGYAISRPRPLEQFQQQDLVQQQ